MTRLAEQRMVEAIDAGAFDNLSGAGKPLADLDEPYDELWWVRKWLREQASAAPRPPNVGPLGHLAAVETLRMSTARGE